LTVTVKVPIA